MHDIKHPVFKAPNDVNAKIWRFINIEQLWSLLERESLHFSRVTVFEDPFEARVPEFNKKMGRQVYSQGGHQFKSEQAFEKFLKARIQAFETLYEQMTKAVLVNCWHLNEYESASMWKVYSTNNYGVSIQSTYQRLSGSFKTNTSDIVYIGKVRYADFTKEWMDERNAYEPFVLKRTSFESEAELRALTTLPYEFGKKVLSDADKEREKTNPSKPKTVDPKELTKNGKFVKVDLETLIETIYIAPLASEEFEEMVKSIIKKISPNLVNKIKKSELYTLR